MFTFDINETKKQEINTYSFFTGFYNQQPIVKNDFSQPYFIINKNQNNEILENYIKTVFDEFSTFKKCFLDEKINIKDEKELFTFFLNNKDFLDIELIKVFLKLIRTEFTENREIIFNYSPEDKNNMLFCIRQNDYNESNLNELISNIEDKIIDMLEDEYPKAGFDISFYTDYKKPEFLDSRKLFTL